MKRVVVVGGGVIGVACAYYLNQAGHQVTILEKGTVGGGCSHANCGYVCPSHVLPLAGPGMLGKTLKTLIQKDSPLKVRFRLDPLLWSWLFRFARRCNHRDMMQSGYAIQALLNSARSLYSDLFKHERIEAEWEERGLLFVFQTPREMDHYAQTDRLLREHFNMGAKRYDGQALLDLEPALKPGLPGGWHYELDAHLRPDKLMSSWKELLLSRGVDIRENCELLSFDKFHQRIGGVFTSQGLLPVDAVVVATGAWTPLLNKHLGCAVPIVPGKGYSITMAQPKVCPKIPLIFEEHRVAITPMKSIYRIGSTMEFAGYDDKLDPKRLEILTRGASPYLQEPVGEPVLEKWWGWRPMVYDGKPIIGPSPVWSNVFIAAGHGMLGLSMATSTGKLITELVGEETPHVDPNPYSVTRF